MSQPRIIYDGVHFIIAGERVYDYHQGTNWNAADKQRRNNVKVTNTWCFFLSAVFFQEKCKRIKHKSTAELQ